MIYVDPSSAGVIARVLAPIFILVSMLGIQFKQRLMGLLQRTLRGPNSKN